VNALLFCHECSEAKHRNCDGTAWDNEADAQAPCTCPDPSHSAEKDAGIEPVCMERVGCHDYRHGTDCPMYDWGRSIDSGRPL
jgi:hypothetical protein